MAPQRQLSWKCRSAAVLVAVLAAMFGVPGMFMVGQFFRLRLDAYESGSRQCTDYLLVLVPLTIVGSFLSVAAYFTQMAVKVARQTRT